MDASPQPTEARPHRAPRARPVLWTILRVAVMVAALGLVLRIVNLRDLAATLQRASLPFLLASLAAYIVDESLVTWKWQRLLHGVNVERSFGTLFRLTLEGRFLAFFLPSSVTSDLYKGAVLARGGSTSVAAFSSIILERILGLLSVVTISLVAVGILPARLLGVNSAVSVFIAVGATVVGLVVFLHADRIASVVLPRLPAGWRRLREFLGNLAGAFAAYRGHAGILALAFVLSLLIQLSRAVAVWVLARGIGDTTPFVYFILLVPYVYLINLLPVASSRVGLEQAVFVGLFSAVGMAPESALAISLLSVAVGFVLVLPFGLLIPFRALGPKGAPS